jgi:hypothetical protein
MNHGEPYQVSIGQQEWIMVNYIKSALDSRNESWWPISSQHWTAGLNHGELYQASIWQQGWIMVNHIKSALDSRNESWWTISSQL